MSRLGVKATGVVAVLILCATSTGAISEVRFGPHVYVGGHDFSNQTFNSKRRADVHLYEHEPRNAGCRWQTDPAGGRVKICHLRNRHNR
jgi:hypothetical protein